MINATIWGQIFTQSSLYPAVHTPDTQSVYRHEETSTPLYFSSCMFGVTATHTTQSGKDPLPQTMHCQLSAANFEKKQVTECNSDHPPHPPARDTRWDAFTSKSQTLVHIQRVRLWCWEFNRLCFTCPVDLWVTDCAWHIKDTELPKTLVHAHKLYPQLFCSLVLVDSRCSVSIRRFFKSVYHWIVNGEA